MKLKKLKTTHKGRFCPSKSLMPGEAAGTRIVNGAIRKGLHQLKWGHHPMAPYGGVDRNFYVWREVVLQSLCPQLERFFKGDDRSAIFVRELFLKKFARRWERVTGHNHLDNGKFDKYLSYFGC